MGDRAVRGHWRDRFGIAGRPREKRADCNSRSCNDFRKLLLLIEVIHKNAISRSELVSAAIFYIKLDPVGPRNKIK